MCGVAWICAVCAIPVADPAVSILHLPADRIRGAGPGVPDRRTARAAWCWCAAGVVLACSGRGDRRDGLLGTACVGSTSSTGNAELRARVELHAGKPELAWCRAP